MAEIWLTEEEVEKRKQKLEYMKSTRRLEIAEMLKIARGFGDLSENAEYDAAKNEQAKTNMISPLWKTSSVTSGSLTRACSPPAAYPSAPP